MAPYTPRAVAPVPGSLHRNAAVNPDPVSLAAGNSGPEPPAP